MRVVIGAALLLALVVVSISLYRLGIVRLNRPDPAKYPITGLDVSHHQGDIDWKLVAGAGVAFTYIKSSEGRDFTDRKFADNWRDAAAAGIPRGAYHFFTFCSPGGAQAEHFLQVVPPAASALPPVADVEFVGNCTSYGDLKAVREELRIFLRKIERAWGRRPLLYLTPDSLERIIGEDLQGYPIWIRNVFTEPAPEAYRSWLLWQFSDNSRIPGISGPVDRNALRPGLSLPDLGSPSAQRAAEAARPHPDHDTEPNSTVVLDEFELRTLRQDDGFNPEFYDQRREDLREGPWHPYDLGTRSE